jgi:hypothetical protein
MADRGPRFGRWQAGLEIAGWNEDERGYAVLLDALTSDLVSAEATGLELDAGSRRSMAEVRQEQKRLESEQVAESRRELEAFRAALRDARSRSGEHGTGEAAYDCVHQEQDEMADLLIQYLVRPGYAEVREEEPEPEHHIYYLRIDWDRLRALAVERGHSLPL